MIIKLIPKTQAERDFVGSAREISLNAGSIDELAAYSCQVFENTRMRPIHKREKGIYRKLEKI